MASVHFRELSNKELINNTRALVRLANTLEVKLLYHLDEIRSRGLEGALGHKSAMQFAIEGLGMTPDQAAKRSAALTNCRRWPELMLLLEQEQISLTTINLVGPKLTPANKEILLNGIIGKSTREVRQLLAEVDEAGERRPQPALIDVKLALPAEVLDRWQDAKALVCGAEMTTLEDALTRIVDEYLERYHPVAKARRAIARAEKTAQRTAMRAEKKAQAATVLEDKVEVQEWRAAIDDDPCRAATAEHTANELAAAKANARRSWGGKLSRYIPKNIQHALWCRAEGRCESPGCTVTHRLQIDHKLAFSRGGKHELDNLQLLCASCHKRKTLSEFGYTWQTRELRQRVEAVDWLWWERGAFMPPPTEDLPDHILLTQEM